MDRLVTPSKVEGTLWEKREEETNKRKEGDMALPLGPSLTLALVSHTRLGASAFYHEMEMASEVPSFSGVLLGG